MFARIVTAFAAADFSETDLLLIFISQLINQILLLNHLKHFMGSERLQIHVKLATSAFLLNTDLNLSTLPTT